MKKFLFLMLVIIVLSVASCKKAPSVVMEEKPEAKAPATEEVTGNPVVDSVGNDLNNVDVAENDLGTEDFDEIDSGLQDIENI